MGLRVPLAAVRIRDLDVADMLRMRVGRDFWDTRLSAIPDCATHKKHVVEFVQTLHLQVAEGRSLILCGNYGAGKTGCGVLVLKECVARGGRALMVKAEELTSAVIESTPFDQDQSLWDRARTVDVLLLDDLRREHVKDFGKSIIESLIRRRADEALTTVITTNASTRELKERYEAATEVLRKCGRLVMCAGVDWRNNPPNEDDNGAVCRST